MGLGIEKLIPIELIYFIRYSAIAGFAGTVAIVININHELLKKIIGEKPRSFWIVFLTISILVLFISLFAFSILFDRVDFRYRNLILLLLGRL